MPSLSERCHRRAQGDKGDRRNLLGRVDALRAYALSLVFPGTDGETLKRLRYGGCDPMSTPDGLPLAAYKLRFGLVTTVEKGEDTLIEA